MTDAAISGAAPPVEMGFGRRALILVTLTFVTMLYTMTVMIVNVALPKMQGTFSATADQIALVVTFNIVATAVATPMSGWLASRFSRRALMLYCSIGFTVASVLCGVAGSLEQLVVFRVFQGAFGAPLVPLATAMVLDTFPRHQQGTATAVFSMGVVFGPIIGPTVGGYLAEALGWRYVFFLLVPFGVLAIVSILAVIDDRRKAPSIRLDWFGFVLLAIAIAAFQLMLDRGQRLDWFDSPEIIAEAAIAALCFYLFLAHVTTSQAPFFDIRMLADRNYAIGFVIAFLFGMILWTPMVLFPPMMAGIQGYPEAEIGLFIALRGLGTLAGSILMAFINRLFDPRVLLAVGFLIQGVAGWYMAAFDINLAPFALAWTSVLAGFGVGFVWVPLTLITYSTLDKRYLNDATAFFHLVRNVGSSISISVSVAVVIRTASITYVDLTPYVSIFADATSLMGLRGDWPLDETRQLKALSAEIDRQGLMLGYINAFYFYTVTAFAVLPLIALVRLKPPERD
ncbi:DHA2 family efflux MFS transporter permease subunit [Thalassobaculum sp.]|uniref:DHA2 family efflux MFS transporter permease subunit n=1 Tax=Thalassobaculum sp. TaxID=2022740 RepID=UPI0032EAFBEB